MDFARLELSDQDERFLNQARGFLAAHLTEDVLRRAHETGDCFDEELHLAMGEHGWLAREAAGAADGGFTPVQRRIWDLEPAARARAAGDLGRDPDDPAGGAALRHA